MNLDMFSNIDGLVLRDSSAPFADRAETMEPGTMGAMPANPSLAMAYVPYQCWEEPLSAADALEAGTVFPSLVKPFMMGKGGAEDGREALEVFGFNGKG